MTFDFIQHAFIAGELSPTLLGRTDLEKYDLGLLEAYNCFVDYRGGVSSRPGTHFIGFVKHDDRPTKYIPFQFAPNLADVYVLLFGHQYLRFIKNQVYVLEAEQSITDVTQADPGVVTINGHGYSTGDWVRIFDVVGMTDLNGRTFEIGATTSNTFELLDPFGNNFDTSGLDAYTSGGVAARIYTVTTPYDAEDLYELRAHQNRNLVRLTHKDYHRRDLIRNNDTDWDLNESSSGADIDSPDGLTASPSTSGSAGMLWVVTAVDENGEESVGSTPLVVTTSVNYTSTSGHLKLTWNSVDGAVSYNIYRSIVLDAGAQVSQAMSTGYAGTSFGPEFVDNNIEPDFATTPPNHRDPFADSAITFIEINNQGSGYDKNTTVDVSDPDGSGFRGYPVVNDSGNIIAIVVVNGGSGYTNPTVTFGSVGSGTGADASATVGPAAGNNPGLASVFQQRQLYAASLNQPLTVWGSKPRLFDNFDETRVVVDSDSYEYDLDSEEAAPIRHLMPMRQGIILMSQSGIWRLSGGTDQAITPTNALAEPQSVSGVDLVPPLRVGTNLLFIEAKGTSVQMLSYSELQKVFSGQDVSILSNHLFQRGQKVTHWTYAKEPFKLVWARRSDGALLSFTTVEEQNVFAWAQSWTKGLVEDVLSVEEETVDRVYLMVSRYVNGRWTKMIETLDDRSFNHVEDAWCVDSGLALPQTTPDADLDIESASGNNVLFTADSSVFVAGDVGKVLRAGGGKAEVVTFVDGQNVRCDIHRDIVDVLPEDADDKPLVVESGDWTLDEPVMEVGGLWHLEGEKVSILADGSVQPSQTVSNGRVSLQSAATRVIVGLPFTMRATTLPLSEPRSVIEGRRKRIVGVVARLNESRGLKIGADRDKMYELKERTTEDYGEPIALIDGQRAVSVAQKFERDAVSYYRQDYPLPVTLLGVVLDVEIGDDRD